MSDHDEHCEGRVPVSLMGGEMRACYCGLRADKARLTRELAEARAENERLRETQRKFGVLQHQFMSENERLHGLLREGKEWRRHKASCNLYFTRETGSNLAASHCNCGFNEHESQVDAALGAADQPETRDD